MASRIMDKLRAAMRDGQPRFKGQIGTMLGVSRGAQARLERHLRKLCAAGWLRAEYRRAKSGQTVVLYRLP